MQKPKMQVPPPVYIPEALEFVAMQGVSGHTPLDARINGDSETIKYLEETRAEVEKKRMRKRKRFEWEGSQEEESQIPKKRKVEEEDAEKERTGLPPTQTRDFKSNEEILRILGMHS